MTYRSIYTVYKALGFNNLESFYMAYTCNNEMIWKNTKKNLILNKL